MVYCPCSPPVRIKAFPLAHPIPKASEQTHPIPKRKRRRPMRTLKREERCKYEVAQELGLLPKLQRVG